MGIVYNDICLFRTTGLKGAELGDNFNMGWWRSLAGSSLQK